MSGGHQHGHGHECVRSGAAGWRRALGHLLRPHSHDHAASTDAALEGSAAGIRAVKLSLAGLGVTCALQLMVAMVSASVALLADAVHNLADALTAVPLWVAFVLARRPATSRFTYGYGRAEDLAGLFVVLVIAASAVLAGVESVRRLLHPEPVHYVGWVMLAGLIGFAGNELVALYRIRTGRRIGSAALVADGLHARADGFTSLAVVIGAAGVAAGFPLADPIAGLLITVAILGVLRGAVLEVGRRLLDGVDPELVATAEHTLAATFGVHHVDEVRLRWIGHRLRAEVAITAGAHLSLAGGHRIAEDARHRLLHALPRLADATVHVGPHDPAGQAHAVLGHHFAGAPHGAGSVPPS
jgi:cation diffusion facilitator family transporter